MSVPQEVIEKARALLQTSARPLIFHDDDPDGTCSFVMIYQYTHDGKGTAIKTSPILTEEYYRKVDENSPDLIIVLDKPKIAPEFLDRVKTPILWIDHHEPQTELAKKYPNLLYINPRIWNDADNKPTSYWSYIITQQNLWIATVGCVADWYVPPFIEEFKTQYPDLAPEKHDTIDDVYVNTKIATLIRVIQFNLKGQTIETRKSILTLTRIESPYEILQQTTARGKFLWKKYQKIASIYDRMLVEAKEAGKKEGPVLQYIYTNEMAITSELSNELQLLFPTKVILAGRHHDGFYKCSARSRSIELPSKINAAVAGLDGYGGGHKFACGLVVAEKDWETFLERFTALVKKESQ